MNGSLMIFANTALFALSSNGGASLAASLTVFVVLLLSASAVRLP